MKEQILNTFQQLGFELDEMEGFGYGFKYEGLSYLLMHNNDDDDFLSLTVPALVEICDIGSEKFYLLLDKVNSTLKYVKACKFGDSLWLFYERELFGEENLEEIITRMILHLEAGTIFTHRTAREMENGDTKEAEVIDENETDE